MLVNNMSKDLFIFKYTNRYIRKAERLKAVAGHKFIPGGGALLGILYGVYGPVLQILTVFRTKKCHFSHRLSYCWPLNSIPLFTPK